MSGKGPTYRVVCAEHVLEVAGPEQAERQLAAVEKLGGCRLLHTVEALVDGQWVPMHLVRAREILAAPCGATLHTADGPLIKNSGAWPKQAGERADAVADAGRDPQAWIAALGAHERAILTGDGREARRDGWCSCLPPPALETWIRYERWTGEGRVGHGFLCPSCRFLTQTG